MLKQTSKQIDGISFTTTQYPAMRGFALFGKLIKTIGPALGVLSGANQNADLTSLAPMIAAGLKDLDPDAATALAVEVMGGTSAIIPTPSGDRQVTLNTRENIDLVFMGKLPTMFKVLVFAAQVNFGDFFGGSDPSAPVEALS